MLAAHPLEGRRYSACSDDELLRRYHEQGDVGARQALIERHLVLVQRLARRYGHRGEAVEDLTQVGCLGLIKAIDRYDGRYHVSLSTYAAPNILGEIKRHFRDKGWTLRVPRDVQELNVRLSRVTDELTVELGRSPSVDELATAAHAGRERVLEALASSRAYSPLSLSEPGDDEDGGGAASQEAVGEEDEGYERSDDRELLRTGLRALPQRERVILHLRFFEGLTQSEIAARLGISQMHVSRLIRQSVARIRDELSDSPAPV